MAKIRQVLISTDVETAGRKRICHHDRRKHAVLAGRKVPRDQRPDERREKELLRRLRNRDS